MKWISSEAMLLNFHLKLMWDIWLYNDIFCSQLIDLSTPSTTGWVGYSIPPPTVTTGSTGGTWEPHSVPPTVWQGPPTPVSIGTTCPLRRERRNVRLRSIPMCVNIEMGYTKTESTGCIHIWLLWLVMFVRLFSINI